METTYSQNFSPKKGSLTIVIPDDEPSVTGNSVTSNEPHCPDCGSNEIMSKGVAWLCKSCGRWFNKNKRLTVKLSEKSPRPPCPECGSEEVYSKGKLYWACQNCRKCIPKHRQNAVRKTGSQNTPQCGENE